MAQRKNDCITYLLHMDPLSGATEQNLSLGEGENNKKNEILLIFKNNLYKFPILGASPDPMPLSIIIICLAIKRARYSFIPSYLYS